MITKRIKFEFLVALVLFTWPFVFLYRLVIPGLSSSIVFGNDFQGLYYDYKVYLLEHLVYGKIPLWSPAEGAGYPFYVNPFTQSFYPLNFPLAIYYRLVNGLSIYEYQLFTIAGVGIFSIGLYFWLRSLLISRWSSVVSAGIFSVSFKITEILRFPNAIHTIAWVPWLLLGLNLARTHYAQRLGPKIILVSVFLIITAGYPYYVYYLIFLVAPYWILILIKPDLIVGRKSVTIINFIKNTVLPALAILIVTSPYWLGVIKLMKLTTDREGELIQFSSQNAFSLKDSLGSLFFPPAAIAEGWFYFGIGSVFVIILNMIWNLIQPYRNRSDLSFSIIIIFWIGIISWITYGYDSELFKFLWKFLPGFSQLRVWPRLNIILVPLLALLFAQAWSKLTEYSNKLTTKIVIPAAIGVSIVWLKVYKWQSALLADQGYSNYWNLYFHEGRGNLHEYFYIIMGWVSYLTVIAIVFHLMLRDSVHRKLLFFLLLVLSIIDLHHVGSKQWSYLIAGDNTIYQRRKLSVGIDKLSVLDVNRKFGYHIIPLDSKYSVGYIYNWYYKSYIDWLKLQGMYDNFSLVSISPEIKQFLGLVDGSRIWFTPRLDYKDVVSFMHDAQLNQNVFNPIYYDGDQLLIKVEEKTEGYISFIDNWDEGWKVTVDGQTRSVIKLFGTFKSVRLEPGNHFIQFSYLPNLISL
jgi:hypothetical protein